MRQSVQDGIGIFSKGRFTKVIFFLSTFFLLKGYSANYVYASCGASFCMVNTNWDMQGSGADPGFRLDFRYEFIEQDQPMSGKDKVSAGEIARHHDEEKSVSKNYLMGLDYTINDKWGVSTTVPYVDIFHAHTHNHHGEKLDGKWEFRRLGDIRVLGRYQLMSENSKAQTLSFYGLNFGFKLPTGEWDVNNSNGDKAERTLQPGTGTTDFMLGAFYSHVMANPASSWFMQVLWQSPINSRDDYKPGDRISVDLGYRYEVNNKTGLMLQLNALDKNRDSGDEAEPDDSGSNFIFISPGVSYAITKNFQIYGFIQKALYQYVNGVQLTAEWSGLFGVSSKF